MTDEEQVYRLTAIEEIKDLRSKYAWYATRGDVDGLVSLFTEDCIFDGPSGFIERTVIQGRGALRDFLAPSVNVKGAILALIHNHIIDVDGDEASGSCVFESPLCPGFGHLIMQYIERFRRVEGKWLIAERKVYMMMPHYQDSPEMQGPPPSDHLN